MLHVFNKYLNKSGNLNSNLKEHYSSDPNILELFKTYTWCESIKEILFCVKNNITTQPKCPSCGNCVSFRSTGYGLACSINCVSKCESVKNIKKQKSSENYNNKLLEYKKSYSWINTLEEAYYCQKNQIQCRPKCFCGNHIKFVRGAYPKRCSYKCANKQDAPARAEATKKTCLQKYGVDNYAKSLEFKQRQDEIQNKIIETNYIRHGCKSFNQKNCIDLEKTYDRDYLYDQHVIKGIPIYIIAENHRVSQHYLSNRMKKMGIPIVTTNTKTSYKEQQIYDFLVSINQSPQRNQYGILSNNREIDLLVTPTLGIEVNSLYWHSYDKPETNIQRLKHQQKSLEATQKNIQILHIWDYEWKNARLRQIWQSVLKSKLGIVERIYGRKCVVKKVDPKVAKEFCKMNHLQGASNSSIAYGLYYNDELKAIMTFCKSRFNKKYQYELLRFCTLKNTQIVGGASKIIAAFEKDYKPTSLISYANMRWSNGKLYESIGFTYSHTTKPNYFYVNKSGTKIFSRNKCQKHRLSKWLENFDPNHSETTNMFNNNYKRVWDAGNLVYVKIYDQ